MKYKSNKKIILLVLYWVAGVFKCSAQKAVSIDCSNDELVTSIFNDPIDLTLRGVIKIYENVAINEILSTTNNEFEQNYIDARLESSSSNETKNLILFTTDRFENYAKEQTAARISLKINLGCGMGKERVVIFFQPLKEGNYFRPVFSKINYELMVPTPIFAGFDLTAFLEITARDDDLTHNQIHFASNDSSQYYIGVGTKNVTTADKKTYFANLTLERILLELPQPIEFEIVATDNGNPPKSSKAVVKISSDPNRSLPPKPQFAETLYKGFINIDFHMKPIQIQLSNGTYTPEVDFSLDGGDLRGFSLLNNKNGSIEIIWNQEDMNRSEILIHRRWELNVKAEHKNLAEMGVANVLIEMADIKSNFHFVSSYYEGNIDEIGELHINPIILNPYIYQSDMTFTLQSSYDFFYFSQKNFSLQLQLNKNFSWQAIDAIGFLKLTLLASWESLSSLTDIVIKVPHIRNETLKQIFQFEKHLYVGQLNETFDLELEAISLKTDVTQSQDIEYSLNGNDSDKFYIMQNDKLIVIKAIFHLSPTTSIKARSPFLLVLQAKYQNNTAFTTVVIKAPEIQRDTKKNIFLMPLIKGTLLIHNDTQKLAIESTSLAIDLEEQFNELKFRLRGDHSLHFEFKKNFTNRKLDMVLKTPLSSHILETKQLLNLTLQAILSGDNNLTDTLFVFIELPVKKCPASLITPPESPQFSSNNYVFTVYTNQTGILGIVNAYSKGGNTTLYYTLGVQDDLLAQRLSINPFTGELSLYGVIEEGNYLFNITAENIETRERAVARALLKVQQKEECSYYEGVAVEKTLMILHVDEEKPNYGLFDMKFNENCSFHIEDMWPKDKEYVNVNFIFNMLDAIAIDREDEIFENMTEPQILVKLKLKCDLDNQQQQGNFSIDVSKPEKVRASQINLSDDIPYSPDVTWIYLKIDDINDNAPEFKVSEGPVYLGYPSGNAALDIYPEYLTQIVASDRDVGYNAEILYAMKNNSYFDIEAKTGKIYPKGIALGQNEQTELIVMAIDQYGEGLISHTVVIVKALSSDFYSLITLKEKSAKTKQQLEGSLSQEFGYNINILKMSYMPQEGHQRSMRNQNFSCKAWIYAYDRHHLVTYHEIQKQVLLKNSEFNIKEIESYEEAALRSPPRNVSNLGYLIATILLSLISCLSLVFIVWRYCYKSATTTECDTKSSPLSGIPNENGKKEINTECCHGFENVRDCSECNSRDNHVKFSDLVENGIADESQSK